MSGVGSAQVEETIIAPEQNGSCDGWSIRIHLASSLTSQDTRTQQRT